ncbi:hypothetical protein RAA17_18590 [Komagataeibacter rhaeticus]|nr:hypothetical protein [Komagataeibacter rhaeticus]
MLGRGLRLTQRICYMAAATNYFFAIPRMMFLLAPLAYLFLGVTMIAASPYELAVYALPHLFHTTMTMSRLQGGGVIRSGARFTNPCSRRSWCA